MKTTAFVLTLALLAGTAAYITAQPATAPASQPSTAPASQPATKAADGKGEIFNKMCAVEQAEKVDPNGKTYVYNGKTIGFCCDDCVDKFKANPEKYMANIK